MVLVEEFLGARSPIISMGEGVPRGRFSRTATPDLDITDFWRNLAKVGDFIRRSGIPFRPDLPAHIPRMTFVAGKLPQTTTTY